VTAKGNSPKFAGIPPMILDEDEEAPMLNVDVVIARNNSSRIFSILNCC